jgi:hypothetical protein
MVAIHHLQVKKAASAEPENGSNHEAISGVNGRQTCTMGLNEHAPLLNRVTEATADSKLLEKARRS